MNAKIIWIVCVQISTVRRGTRSTTTPPIGDSSTIGNPAAQATIPSQSSDLVR